ncbi:MAG: hypothetical protein AAB382_02770, partial [Chloroflexota bacterium]
MKKATKTIVRMTTAASKGINKARLVGRYIVTDPAICHGKPTFGARASWLLMCWNRSQKGWPGRPSSKNGMAVLR